MNIKLNRISAVLLTLVMGMGLLAGCGVSDGGEKNDKEINICIWGQVYSEAAIDKFEKDTGISVNITYITNTDEMISKLISNPGEYDVVDIESAYVKSFVKNGLLQKVDHSVITNEQYLEPYLTETGPIGDEAMTYTVPNCAYGYTTIVYNTETCPIKISSFRDLADPALKGKVALVNSTNSLYGAALAALGYSPDTVNEDEISKANDLLMEIKKNVKTFVGDTAVSILENGDCSVALCFDYASLCYDSDENWKKFAIADIDSDYERFGGYWGIPAGSEKKEEAQEFINYMISPEAVAMHVTDCGQIPMVQRKYLEALLPEGFYDNPCLQVYEDLASKSWMVAVDDKQIEIMDKYYTLLMSEN